MKKAITFFTGILLVFKLSACGSQDGGAGSQTSQPAGDDNASQSMPDTSEETSDTRSEDAVDTEDVSDIEDAVDAEDVSDTKGE